MFSDLQCIYCFRMSDVWCDPVKCVVVSLICYANLSTPKMKTPLLIHNKFTFIYSKVGCLTFSHTLYIHTLKYWMKCVVFPRKSLNYYAIQVSLYLWTWLVLGICSELKMFVRGLTQLLLPPNLIYLSLQPLSVVLFGHKWIYICWKFSHERVEDAENNQQIHLQNDFIIQFNIPSACPLSMAEGT